MAGPMNVIKVGRNNNKRTVEGGGETARRNLMSFFLYLFSSTRSILLPFLKNLTESRANKPVFD